MQASLPLFFRDGFEAVGVARLCAAAAVNRGSFYHFFADKEALALEAIDVMWALTHETLFRKCFDKAATAQEGFLAHGRAVLRNQNELRKTTGEVWGCPLGVLGQELSTRNATVRQAVAKNFEAMRQEYEDAYVSALRRGELPFVDAVGASETALALVEGALLMARVQNDSSGLKSLGVRLWRIGQIVTQDCG